MAAKDLRAIRQQYLRSVDEMKDVESSMRRAGRSPEEIARKVSSMRNEAKRATRSLMDPDDVARLEARNREKYGDPVGPSPDWLFQRYKSWDKVIEAAYRTDPTINKMLGLD